jgi:hypothetical protein
MGKAGETTFPNLKQATNIADNRLLYHSPNPPNVDTALSDFLVSGVGRRAGSSEWSQGVVEGIDGVDIYLGIPDTTVGGNDGLPGGRSSTIESDGRITIDDGYRLRQGDRFWVRISAVGAGPYHAEQILQREANLSVVSGAPTGNRQAGTDADGLPCVDVEFEVSAFDQIVVELRYDDGGLNSDAIHFGDPSTQSGVTRSALLARVDSVQASTVYLSGITAKYSNRGGDSPYIDCVGDALDGGGTDGDSSYSVSLLIDINDPAAAYGDLYVWLYKRDDVSSSMGCPPSEDAFNDGFVTKIQNPNGGTASLCHDFSVQRSVDADADVRVVLTRDSAGTSIQDSRQIALPVDGGGTPGGGDDGQINESYSDLNTTPNCS